MKLKNIYAIKVKKEGQSMRLTFCVGSFARRAGVCPKPPGASLWAALIFYAVAFQEGHGAGDVVFHYDIFFHEGYFLAVGLEEGLDYRR